MMQILVGAIVVAVVLATIAWLASARLRHHIETPKHRLHETVRKTYRPPTHKR